MGSRWREAWHSLEVGPGHTSPSPPPGQEGQDRQQVPQARAVLLSLVCAGGHRRPPPCRGFHSSCEPCFTSTAARAPVWVP